MMVYIKVDKESQKIKECKWKTFGCASAIASTSMMSVMVTEKGGMNIKRAINLKPQEILERLGGLPDRKFHCSVLGHLALREAIMDYSKNEKNKVFIFKEKIKEANDIITLKFLPHKGKIFFLRRPVHNGQINKP